MKDLRYIFGLYNDNSIMGNGLLADEYLAM
jgi:hypothetical protein